MGGVIGTAINSFQNQASSTFNSLAGQAQGIAGGFANSVGSVVGAQLCAGGSSCSAGTKPNANAQIQTVQSEQEESEGASENVSANLVEAQAPEQPAQQQEQEPAQHQQPAQQQQQNNVNEEYLPPKQN